MQRFRIAQKNNRELRDDVNSHYMQSKTEDSRAKASFELKRLQNGARSLLVGQAKVVGFNDSKVDLCAEMCRTRS